ncbi:MAG TPA: hypothetical protein VHZ03_15160 [Trebonia sp.]|jgi:hypothetical protein|nr:hypothetical protein [Trebonia sp.]
MSVSHLQDTLAAIAVLVITGSILSVAYWRTTLRVLLAAGIAIAVYGVVVVLYGLAWLVARLH